jgi:hypothetical protein
MANNKQKEAKIGLEDLFENERNATLKTEIDNLYEQRYKFKEENQNMRDIYISILSNILVNKKTLGVIERIIGQETLRVQERTWNEKNARN